MVSKTWIWWNLIWSQKHFAFILVVYLVVQLIMSTPTLVGMVLNHALCHTYMCALTKVGTLSFCPVTGFFKFLVPVLHGIDIYWFYKYKEIPGGLLCKNMTSSHKKITCYLHTRKDDHHCSKPCLLQQKWNLMYPYFWCLCNK